MRDMSGSLDSVRRVAILASGALAGLGLAQFSRNTFGAISSAQKLQASLETVTGSADAAGQAWESLLEFASETPFTLEQSVQGFIRMKSLGLDPTNDALRSFGNTASAMGKDMMQMVEAVADATTGEFERLKEFGIRASKEGNQITFTFQGVETTVRNSSEAISEYLQSIGENQFAGAMADQMDTLGGKMSNLQDSVYQLYIAIGDAGATDAFSGSIDRAADSVERLTAAIENGAFDDLIGFFQDANTEGNAFIAEIYGIKEEAVGMKNTLSAGLLEIEASFLDMRATGVEAFAGLAAGAADTINKGLVPIQQALNYLDETFANLLENVGNLLGPAGGNFIAQAEAIRNGLIDPQGLAVESLENTSEALRDQAEAARQSAEAIRSGGEAASQASSLGFKPLSGWLFDVEQAASGVNKGVNEASGSTKEAQRQADQFASSLRSLEEQLFPLEAAQRQYRSEQMLLTTALTQGKIGIERYMDAWQRLEDAQRSGDNWQDAYGLDGSATKELEKMDGAARDLGLTFESAFEDAIIGGEGFREVLSGIAEDIARIALRKGVTEPASDWLTGAISTGISAFAGGGGGGYSGGWASSATYAEGGYTGDGAKMDPAGVVHKGEFVVKKSVVDNPGVRPFLEGLNKGYASGGYVGGGSGASIAPSITYAPQVTVQAQPGATQEDVGRQVKAFKQANKAQFAEFLREQQRPGGMLAKR
jgi:hypothetical protein